MPKIQYSLQAEKAKKELVKKLMEGVSPVVIAPFDTGVVAAAPNPSGFRKIRKIHDTIMFAAVGEHQDINEACLALINAVSSIESAFSARDVSIDALINDPTGIVGHISRAFRSLDIRPMAVEFILCSFAEVGGLEGVIINPCGERSYVDGNVVIGDTQGSISTLLEERTKNHRLETKEEAVSAALNILEEISDSAALRTEIGILKKDGNQVNFHHSWEER